MHEFSLMESVVRITKQAAQQNNLEVVTGIFLVVGAFSGVNSDSLRFAFEILQKEEPILEGVALEIEEPPAEAECPHCHVQIALRKMDLLCPNCGRLPLKLRSGEEFYVKSIAGERANA